MYATERLAEWGANVSAEHTPGAREAVSHASASLVLGDEINATGDAIINAYIVGLDMHGAAPLPTQGFPLVLAGAAFSSLQKSKA